MAKNPENRYQSAAEMRSDVLRAAGGEPVRATPVMDQTAVVTPMTGAMPVANGDDGARRRGVGYAILAAAVIGALVLGFFLVRPLFSNTTLVRVPDLSGLTVAEANAKLVEQNLDLVIGVPTKEASNSPIDTIISQTPASGNDAAAGSTINIVVSTGPASTVVPTLIGLSLDTASQRLAEADLELGTRTQKSSSEPAGTVLDTDPPEGASVKVKTKVNVTVSSGPVDVPDVVGATRSQATATLEGAGFQVLVVKSKTNTVAPGIVIAQSPKAQTSAKQGSTVTITVAEAAPTPPPTSAPPVTVPPTTP
jgi:eukaryotic-like serine/threonine-protein kinase